MSISSKATFIINSLEGGGAERVFCKLIELINLDSNRGYDFSIVIIDKKDEAYRLPENVKVYRVSSSKFISFIKIFFILRKEKPKFVVSFLIRSNFINVFYSKIFNYSSYISERSNTENRIKGRFLFFKRYVFKKLYNSSSKIICCSKGVSDCLVNYIGVDINRVSVINNPYNILSIEKLSLSTVKYDQSYIVGVGRLVKTKGFSDLITAYSKLNTDLKLKIVGEGPERSNLESLCRKLNIEDNVHFMGFVSNPYPLIKNSKFYVLSSYTEGFPNTLMEAMALSKPVISTNCFDGPNEILEYFDDIGEGGFVKAPYGLMVNTGDVIGLKNAMQLLIHDVDLYKSLELKSIERAGFYTEDVFYDKYKLLITNEATLC